VCLWTIFRITFSSSLPIVDKRLIGCKFCGNLESLPVFGKVIIFASFQDVGKWESRRQWLIRCVKCTEGLLGSYSFGMPSIPQAFLSFREFTNFCRSRGLILLGGLLSTGSSRAWTLASTCLPISLAYISLWRTRCKTPLLLLWIRLKHCFYIVVAVRCYAVS
jgi:hypothetical protein